MLGDIDEWRETQEEGDILAVLSQGQGLSCGVLFLSQSLLRKFFRKWTWIYHQHLHKHTLVMFVGFEYSWSQLPLYRAFL